MILVLFDLRMNTKCQNESFTPLNKNWRQSNEEVEAAESKLREMLGEDSSLSDFNNNISELEAMCPITETLTDHEIIDNARDDQPEEEPEEPEQSADPEPPKPQLKASDIVVRLQDCEEWLEKQSDADPLQLIHLRNLRSFAQRKTQKSLKD